MEKLNCFGYLLIGFVIVMALKIYSESDVFNLKCIISHVDGNTYCVRERDKIQLTADLLATVTQKLKLLVIKMREKYPGRTNVQRLIDNFNPKKVKEILPTSKFTAYSENKGEKLALCVTTTKKGNNLIDENTLIFVAIHEVAHTMTKSIGHKEEFWKNFKFLLVNAVEMGIVKPINYKEKPKQYCGMTITDNPFYDI